MKQKNVFTLFVVALLGLILAACSQQAAPSPNTASEEAPGSPQEVLKPVMEAQKWLAGQLGSSVDQVEVVSFSPEEWSDSCLGLGGPAESCLQAITPGYKVTLKVDGQEYEVRTDSTGETIRSPQFPA